MTTKMGIHAAFADKTTQDICIDVNLLLRALPYTGPYTRHFFKHV